MKILKRIRKARLTAFLALMAGLTLTLPASAAEDDSEPIAESSIEKPSTTEEPSTIEKPSTTEETPEVEKNPIDNTQLTSEPSAKKTSETDEDQIGPLEPGHTVTPSLEENEDPHMSEDRFREYMAQFDGRTIVDIEFDGASEKTLPTVRAAMMQHVGDTFTLAAVTRDRDSIMNTGYFYDMYQTVDEVPEGVVLKYHLLENPILNDIEITGNEVEKLEDLQKVLTMRRGEVLNSSVLQEDIEELQNKYRDDGYILMKVTDMNLDKEGILHLKISEGILEGYAVKGNKKTKDKVILREMRQKPGEVFNAKSARRSMQRVYNLGFFEDVNIKMNPGVEPNAIVMEINVKEKRTGTFGIGAGYSSEDGVIGMVSIADTNFRGVGDAVSLTFEMSGDDEDAHGVVFAYKHPWIDQRETAGLLRIYNRTYEYDDYDTRGRLKEEYMRKYSGGEFTFSRPVSEYSTNYLTLRHRKDDYVKHVSSGNAGNRAEALGSSWRRKNFGTTRSVTMEHVTDTRDNIYNPTEGARVNLSAEFGGWLGGDFDFQKYGIDHQAFFKAGHVQVWALRAKAGLGHGDISEFNQYRIGGQDSLRGYREDQFRGERMTAGTIEYRFPLFNKVQGALFTDWGAAWDTGFDFDDFHGSVGMGLALTTPLGPLRLDYGRGSQGGRFHFSVGGAF